MSRKRSHEDVSEDDDVFVYYENTDLTSIPKDITSLRIDSSVRAIPAITFKGRRHDLVNLLVNVEYQEGLEVIGDESFYECTSLRKQQFPSTLVEIGNRAFHQCNTLESVGRLPLSLKVIRDSLCILCMLTIAGALRFPTQSAGLGRTHLEGALV